jgi:dTDP-4-dehydrorhamnose 3,5-epimerase
LDPRPPTDPGDVVPAAPKDAQTADAEGSPVGAGIEGVVTAQRRWHADHRGRLAEVVDFDDSFWDDPVVYGYCFTIRPGRIKGWGMHRKQDDRYFVASGLVRVVLHDGRKGSPTFGQFQEVHFTDHTPGLVRIPAGVWHADQNYGDREAIVMNFPTRPFDREDPDKYRIDPHSGEIPFDWSLPDG